jgi:hypothetical protein
MSDFDGDGWPDILVGAPSAGTAEQGAIYKLSVRTGAPLGTSPWSGDAAGDEFGCCVSDSLDATGDGIPDYVVGAPKRDDARPGSDAGMAYLYDGRDGSFIAATGQGGGHSLYGGSVSLGPDVDGDGLADIVVGGQYGDPSGRSEAGAAYVYSGASRSQLARLDGRAAGDHFGGCVSLGPDADGDTRGDILIGARNADPDGRADAGVAYLYSGSTFGVLHEWRGSEAGAQLGYSVRAVPDFDGDGRADALIGIPFAAPSGIVRLFSGSGGGLIRTIAGGDASASFGATVDGRLDADGDDVPDILVGAPNAEAGRGRVFLYSGADGRELLRWTGEAEGDHLGRTAAYLVPDINGDDLADVIVTASDALEQRGKVYVFSGPELSD